MAFLIKKQWFDMIATGIKKEEYIEIKPYYTSRFQTLGLLNEKGVPTGEHKWIVFRNGCSSDAPTVTTYCSLAIQTGNPEWGAVPDVEYYALLIEKTIFEKNAYFNEIKQYIIDNNVTSIATIEEYVANNRILDFIYGMQKYQKRILALIKENAHKAERAEDKALQQKQIALQQHQIDLLMQLVQHYDKENKE